MTGYPNGTNWKGTNWVLRWLLMLTIVVGVVPAAQAADADHLIISEIVVTTRNVSFSVFGSPYIMVVNPTASDVEMGEVFLSDGNSATAAYYNLPLADLEDHHSGGGQGLDFHVRFPDGYILAAGDSLAISVNGSDQYEEAYGRLPDFELFEDASSPDQIPELVKVFPGSVGIDENVENSPVVFSSLVLYTWDGEADSVQDLDYVVWGTDLNSRIDKTGVTVGSHTYLDDTPVASQDRVAAGAHDPGYAFRRTSADEGTENSAAGNGAGGHDETSENFSGTWSTVLTGGNHGVPSAPGTFHPAAPILSGGSHSPALPYDGQEVELSVSIVSGSAITATFHYSVDGGDFTDLAAINTSGALFTATIPAQVENSVVTWYCTATNAGGGQAVYPDGGIPYAETWSVDEAPDPSLFPTKLLLTEICTMGAKEEFVEITNPSDHEVDLSDYYIGDAVYHSGPTHNAYYFMGAGAGPSTTGGGHHNDFLARFPDGFSIDAGDTIVISIPGSGDFASSFGFLPDLELYEDDQFPDNVPDMRPIFELDGGGNSIVGETVPTLTNDKEAIALYHWNEGDDLVVDIDIFTWGPGGSYTINKTGVTVGSSTYLPDTPQGSQESYVLKTDFDQSYQRVDGSEGTQIATGGNGVTGMNETSENWETTYHADHTVDKQGTFEALPSDPSRPGESSGGGGSGFELVVEPKTFIPTEGELFPIFFNSKQKSETKLRIFDLEGRVVNTLYDSRRNGSPAVIPGVYTVVAWDGRDEEYQRVRAGMYIVHLQVVNATTGEQEFQTAPVVVATWLSR